MLKPFQEDICKIPFAKPEILNSSEYDKDISILIDQKVITVSHISPSLTSAHAILLKNTKTKETSRVVVHTG